MKNPLLLNNGWHYKPSFDPKDISSKHPEGFERVNLPHTVKELPFNNFSHDETAMITSYYRDLSLPQSLEGKRVVLRFDGVMAYYELYVNGRKAADHRGGYSLSYVDITDHVVPGEDNRLFLMVDSTERNDIPPFGYIVDYLTYGGIYRDVYLYELGQTYVRHVLARYALDGDYRLSLFPEAVVENHGPPVEAELLFTLRDKEGHAVKTYSRPVSLASGRGSYPTAPEDIGGVDLWSIGQPTLYTLETRLVIGGREADSHETRTGFRRTECTAKGFFLNGQKVKLIGLNRHQSYPYVGYAMGRRVQRKDADLIRTYLGCNMVRTSHYMQSQHFLDRCDELGLLVFEEIPGWHYIGGEVYRQVVMNDVEMMITTDYNHPGIVIWGVRLNESEDCPELYDKTNALAKRLDPDRATTGVRFFKGSDLKEDIYAINDFCHKGPKREDVLQSQRQVTGLSRDVPYMVSEFCGHVYPCKTWDNENVREEHARMHARVQSRAAVTDNIMGALGWCAFDYATHGDYGSGDKICYHGVMDMFRMPKYAAQVYRSQKDPAEEVVLETTSVFSRGEKGDNHVAPVVIMTNCDYIEFEVYGKSMGKFWPSNNYVGLPHPPIEIWAHDSFWIEIWQGAKITGFLNGKEVARRTFVRDARLTTFEVLPDDTALTNAYADDTRVTCRFLDQEGNLLPYYPGVIHVALEGDLEMRGPSTFATMGSMAAFWVRTTATGKPGKAAAVVTALNSGLQPVRVELILE
ncbi:MAG: glycoside hydrolase family 2 TIM barrel-domain containing protein [Candidatus Limiplasma sp.]|nr:glycoside hydrolase family 2 TIM barrel-domain containing protein [Candidatus Limiplasma sp.]